ncbi:hypothetical protein [Brevundimonas naejangsanensis]|uniref:hypothetical protein n=1 Tax=Brevundimonas naejangsanensis TaxID=588932 RepID=UPI0039F6A3B4
MSLSYDAGMEKARTACPGRVGDGLAAHCSARYSPLKSKPEVVVGVYAVSFELKSDSDYSKRYDSLMEQLKLKGEMWDETTSFALVETDESLDDFEHRLYFKSELLDSKDKLFVIDVTDRPCIARGPFVMPYTLKSIMPKVVQK